MASKSTALALPEPPRTAYLGGSDAPAVLGVSPWRTRYRLWCDKAGIEQPPDLSLIDYVYFGILLEPVVAKVFSERVHKKVRVARKLFTHPRYSFIAGHIDRDVLGENAFVECKTANAFDYRNWGESESGVAGVPEYYVAQVDHYMFLRDCTHCYVAALIGGNDFRWYLIKRDAKREKKLLDAELEFWPRIAANDAPAVDNEQDAKHRWKKLIQGTSVPITLADRKKIVRLSRVHSLAAELEKEEKALRNWLFPLFADKELLSEQGVPLARLSAYDRNYFDQNAFEKKHPKIKARFTTTRQSKRLKILI